MPRIEAKIAAIVSSTTVALNVGSNAGVEAGYYVDFFRVVEVVDPDTKENLGSVSVLKGQAKVVHVQERMCVAETQYTFDDGPLSALLPTMARATKGHRPSFIAAEKAMDFTSQDIEVQVGERAVVRSPRTRS